MNWLYIHFVAPVVCLIFGHRDRFTLRAGFSASGQKDMTTAYCVRCKRIHETRDDR